MWVLTQAWQRCAWRQAILSDSKGACIVPPAPTSIVESSIVHIERPKPLRVVIHDRTRVITSSCALCWREREFEEPKPGPEGIVVLEGTWLSPGGGPKPGGASMLLEESILLGEPPGAEG